MGIIISDYYNYHYYYYQYYYYYHYYHCSFFFYFSVNLISLNWIEALLPRFFCFIFPNFLLASGEAEVTFQLLSSRSQRQVSLFSLILCLSSRSQRQVSLFSRLFIFPPTPCLWVLALNARCHSFFPFFFVLNEKKKDEEEEDDENIFVNQFRYRKQKKIIRKETKKKILYWNSLNLAVENFQCFILKSQPGKSIKK